MFPTAKKDIYKPCSDIKRLWKQASEESNGQRLGCSYPHLQELNGRLRTLAGRSSLPPARGSGRRRKRARGERRLDCRRMMLRRRGGVPFFESLLYRRGVGARELMCVRSRPVRKKQTDDRLKSQHKEQGVECVVELFLAASCWPIGGTLELFLYIPSPLSREPRANGGSPMQFPEVDKSVAKPEYTKTKLV